MVGNSWTNSLLYPKCVKKKKLLIPNIILFFWKFQQGVTPLSHGKSPSVYDAHLKIVCSVMWLEILVFTFLIASVKNVNQNKHNILSLNKTHYLFVIQGPKRFYGETCIDHVFWGATRISILEGGPGRGHRFLWIKLQKLKMIIHNLLFFCCSEGSKCRN